MTDKLNFGLSSTERTAIGTSVWAATTRALTDKVGFSLSTAAITSIWNDTSRTLTSFNTLVADIGLIL